MFNIFLKFRLHYVLLFPLLIVSISGDANPLFFPVIGQLAANRPLGCSSNCLVATGGIITESGAYRIHTFNNSGTFTHVSGVGAIEYLVVGGGGAGGYGGGSTNAGGAGGGGGGAVASSSGILVSAISYSVVVGVGGTGASTTPTAGSASSFSGTSAAGGGYGGRYNTGNINGGAGSSGGGGGGSTSTAGTGGTASAGNAGGAGHVAPTYPTGGGGGGAGSAGTSGALSIGGAGGAGVSSSISGTLRYYGGGGGGSAWNGGSDVDGAGGLGGGGSGNRAGLGIAGSPNSGGGGGGGGNTSGGGAGGSGVVIIRYLASQSVNCPSNFVKIYGSPDFCISKYEMRNDGSGNAISQASGAPWSSINQPTARTKCQAMGAGYDLPTIAQWQTVAKNIANIGANWNSGIAYSGQLNRGHSDNSPASGQASSTDNDACANTGQTCSDTVWHDQRRTHILSNGQVIWDFAGNLLEWMRETSINPSLANQYISALTGGGQTSYGNDNVCGTPASNNYCGFGYGYFGYSGAAIRRGGMYAHTTESGVFQIDFSPSTSTADAF